MILGHSILEISIFAVIVVTALFVDLFAHSKDKPISVKNAAIWSAFWVLVSIGFAGFIAVKQNVGMASLFLSGYALEKSLSVDNLFIFMAIFSSFKVKGEYQHRILYYGILGAIILRFVFVSLGSTLIYMDEILAKFFGVTNLPFSIDKVVYVVFGLIVIWSAVKMYQQLRADEGEEEEVDYTHHWAVRWTQKVFPVHNRLVGHNFFTRVDGRLLVTPLFLCLVVVEISDVVFAFDSVPAVIAITKDPFLVYTSNIFAILGLRSMYFLLLAAKEYLCHLEKAVVVILAYIGAKLILESFSIIHISPNVSLCVVLVLLFVGIVSSHYFPEPEEAE